MERKSDWVAQEEARAQQWFDDFERRGREILARLRADLAESRRLSEEGRRMQIQQQRRAAARR